MERGVTHRRAKNALRRLLGEPLTHIGNVGSTGNLGFGPVAVVRDELGRDRRLSRIALHIQCPWRIASPARVELGSADLFWPAGVGRLTQDEAEAPNSPWIPEGFDWEREPTRFTELAAAFLRRPHLRVERVATGSAGAATIALADGCEVQIFPDSSVGVEAWRLFWTSESGAHVVVTG